MLYYGRGGQFGFQTVEVWFQKPKYLKSELSEFRTPFSSDFSIVWISVVPYSDIHCTVECWSPNVLGFRTEPLCSVLDLVRTENYAEIWTICSDFGQKISSEIWMIQLERSDFGIIGILMLWIPKSERSNEPNDLKSEQVCSNHWLFGFQHCLDFGRSDFSISLYWKQSRFASLDFGHLRQ